MKRSFLNSTGPAALLAAFLLGLFLPAGTRAQGNEQVPVQAAEHQRDHPMWLRIMAFTDAPIVGANVRITLGGPHGPVLADARAATNDQGVFPARIWRPWMLGEEADANAPKRRRRRSFVRISISGGTISGDGFLGHLTADVALTDPAHQILVVNPVTTLVSRVLEERPELTLDQAEALVRHLLKLPENYSLGLALRQSSHYVSPFFSPVAFMAEARAAGGLDAFLYLLLQELASPSAGHPFRPPQLLGSAGSSDTAHAQLLGSTGSSDAISVLKSGLYTSLLDVASEAGVENLAGWALSYTGLTTPGASSDDITALEQSLANLQSSIDNLSTQIANLTQLVQAKATQTQYTIITTQAQTLANDVYDEGSRLMYLAQDCPPLPDDGSTPTPPAPGTFCATEPQAILVALSNEPIYSAYTNVESYVKDNGTLGTEGMLHLYSLWLGQTERFFSPADSTQMQNLYDYWDGVLTQAADLKIELLHQQKEQDAGGATLIAFMGNPDATPPTTMGTFQIDQTANQALMWPAVPSGTLINTKDKAMWLLPYTGWIPNCFAPFIGPWDYLPRTPYPVANVPYDNLVGGFNSPLLSGIQNLIAGWSGSSPMSWLVAQGFPNLANSCGWGETVWTESHASTSNSQIYYLMDLATGNVTTATAYDVGCDDSPNGCIDQNQAHFHWVMGARGLLVGEQYYFYQ